MAIHHNKSFFRSLASRLIFTFVFFTFLLSITPFVLAQESIPTPDTLISGEHIKNFESTISVQKDGSIEVQEQILYDFDSLQRHGIYRDIPYIIPKDNGKKYKYDLTVEKVVDEKGENYQKSILYENGNVRIKIGDPNHTITGVHAYKISYAVRGAIGYFDKHDELYWNATGLGWTVPIATASAHIRLPDGVKVSDIKVACYTGAYKSTTQDCTSDISSADVSFSTTRDPSTGSGQVLGANEGLTTIVGFPKNIVAYLPALEVISFWDTALGKLTAVLIGLAIFLSVVAWYIVYPLWIALKWYRYGRDPKVPAGPTRAWYDPPVAGHGRRLTPGETGALIDESVSMADISATIVDLARRGYLKIDERKKKDFYFIRKKEYKDDVELLDFERKLLDGIFSTGDDVRIKDKKLYETIVDVKKALYAQIVADGFFLESPEKVRTYYTVICIVGLCTWNIPLFLSALIFGRAMPRKTEAGAIAANIARSLKNFLVTQERQLEFQAKYQYWFEKLLPFAVAYGVEKIWADRFKNFDLKNPDWYSSYSGSTFRSSMFVGSLNSSFSSIASAATPPTSSSSSGFSSGGGFSGGGGGGGGGGSW